MRIVRDISYLAPEGELTGTVISGKINVDSRNGKPRESVRLTIATDSIPNDPMVDYRVRVDYWESQANDFIRDAKALIGQNARELVDADGNIRDWKLHLLEGSRVKFRVIHDHKPGHLEAFRRVVDLAPLIEEDRKAA